MPLVRETLQTGFCPGMDARMPGVTSPAHAEEWRRKRGIDRSLHPRPLASESHGVAIPQIFPASIPIADDDRLSRSARLRLRHQHVHTANAQPALSALPGGVQNAEPGDIPWLFDVERSVVRDHGLQ